MEQEPQIPIEAQLAEARQAELDAQQHIAEIVQRARGLGLTWRAIGEAVDMSHQGAMQRWDERARASRRERWAKRQAAGEVTES